MIFCHDRKIDQPQIRRQIYLAYYLLFKRRSTRESGEPDWRNSLNRKPLLIDIRKTYSPGAWTVTVFLFVLLPSLSFCSETEWKHLFTRDGIDVYRRSSPETGVYAFKGIGSVEAGIDVVGSVLQDIAGYPQWVARCRESVVLKEINRDTRVFYTVIDTPMPFKDRDIILSNTTVYHPNEGLVEINFNVFNQDILPPREGYCRVNEFSSQYLIEPLSPDRTRVTFVFKGDPGGNIPVTIANWVESRTYPHSIIMGLREMVRKRKCVSAIRADDFTDRN